MKMLFALLGAVLLTVIILDFGTVYGVKEKINTEMEHSLDAALIAGVSEYDMQMGEMYINNDEAYRAAYQTFKDNMKLDDNLENDVMKDTTIDIRIVQGEKPYVQGEVNTVITTLSPKLLGIDGIPVNITKINYQTSNYK